MHLKTFLVTKIENGSLYFKISSHFPSLLGLLMRNYCNIFQNRKYSFLAKNVNKEHVQICMLKKKFLQYSKWKYFEKIHLLKKHDSI